MSHLDLSLRLTLSLFSESWVGIYRSKSALY